jgi:hypothetical protein
MRDRGRYDLAIVGAGSAGFSAALTAAELGCARRARRGRDDRRHLRQHRLRAVEKPDSGNRSAASCPHRLALPRDQGGSPRRGLEGGGARQGRLVTTGRRPNTAGLGLEESGVDLLPNGGIKVDGHMRTTRPRTYAAGDVTGRDQFVYMAAYRARIAAENALNGNGRAL